MTSSTTREIFESTDEYEIGQATTIRVRSSIRGIEGLTISIPIVENEDIVSDSSDFSFTYGELDYKGSSMIENLELKKFVVKSSNIPLDDCAICIDNFQVNQECYILKCSHIFHKKCIHNWISKTNLHIICPICRSSIGERSAKRVLVLRSRNVVLY
jgi:hypothetical protein